MKKAKGCRKARQWETPRPHWPRLDAKLSKCWFPYLPFNKRTVNEWAHSGSHQSFTKQKIQNLRPTIKQDARIPSRRITIFYPLVNIFKDNDLPLTSTIGPESYVASARTTMGPTRVLNFPAVSQKKATIASSRLLFGKTGDPWCPKSCLPSPRRTRTHNHRQQQHFKTFSTEKNTTYLFQIVHSGIFHFPLSFHSAVAPCAPPPLQFGPSSVSLLEGGDKARETVWFSHNTLVATMWYFYISAVSEQDWTASCHRVSGSPGS